MPNSLTPGEISQILEEFFKTVGTRQYIGARYVPIFGRKDETSIVWDNSAPYEPLTIVLYQGNSYTSRQYVPEGVDILNESFWALTGNYNAQVEAYRREVMQFSDEIEAATETANDAAQGVSTLQGMLPASDFSSTNTVKDALDGISDVLPASDFSSTNTVKDALDRLQDDTTELSALLPADQFDQSNTVKAALDTNATAIAAAQQAIGDVNDALPLSEFSEHTVKFELDALDGDLTTLDATVAHDTIFNRKYVGKAVAPVVDGSWYGVYDAESFQIQGMAVVNDNVYFGAHNADDTRVIVTLANRTSNSFSWTREFSNHHIKHINSIAWDVSRNRFMIAGETGYGIRVADASFTTVSAAPDLWPLTTWAGRIAYDRATDYAYVIDEGNNPGLITRSLYWLPPEATTFVRLCDIKLPTYDLQDICAYDDKLFIVSTTNAWALYSIDREAAACTLIESGTFTPIDANNIYQLGECEGCDFGSDGTLYANFTCGRMGVITVVPYEGHQVYPINRNTFQVINAHISNANRSVYRNDLAQFKSISEINARSYKNLRTITYDDTIVEYSTAAIKNIAIVIPSAGNVTFNETITCTGGIVSFINQGTLISNARELFGLYSAPAWLSILCADTSSNTFTSDESRIAYSNTGLGGLVYVHSVPDGFTGKVNNATAADKTLYGFGTRIGTFS